MGNWTLLGALLGGAIIGLILSILTGDLFKLDSLDPVWVQAIGSILAVAVAIYVPWKIDKDKKQAEDEKSKNLQRLSLKALCLEVWLMKLFFANCIMAIDKGSVEALQDLTDESLAIDPKSPIVMEPEKYQVLASLPDETTTLYMNCVSRRFFSLSYMKAYLSDLEASDGRDRSLNSEKSKEYCQEGMRFCNKILSQIKNEFDGLTFDLKIGENDSES